MAWQRVKTLVLVLCCADLVFSQSPKLISPLNFYSSADNDYIVDEAGNSAVQTRDSGKEIKSELDVYCYNDTMKVILPSGSLSQVKILGFTVNESMLKTPSDCAYSLTKGHGQNVLVVDYTGCPVILEDGRYTLTVLYPNEAGKLDVATLYCDAIQSLTVLPKLLHVQSDQMPKCAKLPPKQSSKSPSIHASNMLVLKGNPGGCSISADQKVLCSTSGIMQDECLTRGCCFDAVTSVCYYPMDECTADKHFVFAVHNDITNIPVNPMSLMVAGKAGCKPVIANKDFAVFKFSVTECGTHSFVIGETLIYLAEVQTIIKIRHLKYGMISRENPFRSLKMVLLVECRYPKASATAVFARPVLASAGYMVMSPSLPPYLLSEGLFGVQLLISEDKTFTKFYPQCHQPLNVLLGKPVYLELRLKSPRPAATLLVHYCVAYPRSAKTALVLLFEGCPNPLDPGNTSILYVKHLPQNRHQRRFEIKAFQFMDLSTKKYLNEEIYFMCSTEVCMPSGLPCAETCFDGKSQ